MKNHQTTQRGFTQEDKNVAIKQSIIPEFISESSTQVVTQEQRQAWKPLGSRTKTLWDGESGNALFQGLSNFMTTRGFTLIELLVVVLIIGILYTLPTLKDHHWR